MKEEDLREKASRRKTWLRDTLGFFMKDYAERTGSRLEIKERGTELYVTLQNDMGFVLTEDWEQPF